MQVGGIMDLAYVKYILIMEMVRRIAGDRDMNTSVIDDLLMQRDIQGGVVQIPAYIQVALIEQARNQCAQSFAEVPFPPENDTGCLRTWDTVACWPDAAPGEVLAQPCPDYIHNFIVTENATRTCRENGTWYPNPNTGALGWTDYTRCTSTMSPFMHEHIPRITLMYNVGYGVSLITLVIAVCIMLYFKRLHCPRNTLHLHLFVSFLLRAGLSLLRDNMFVYGMGLPQDVSLNHRGQPVFEDINSVQTTHWQCKTLTFFFTYFLSANYIWIFIEGLYLHVLIFVSVFSEKTTIMWYIVFGWLSPLTFTIPWAIVRAKLHNIYCWNVSHHPGFDWIIKGPLLIFILINFVFFINIIRVLFTKLKASNTREGRRYRHKKLAKSTLVLIPLFGVHYILFSLIPADMLSETVEIVKLYFEMICNSFQGFLVALLYCYLNGEVQSEIRKTWQRLRLQYTPGSVSMNSRQSKAVTDTVDLMNGHGGPPARQLVSLVDHGVSSGHDQLTNPTIVNRVTGSAKDPDHKRALACDEGCGRLLLEATDDYFISESAVTETFCFSDSVVQDQSEQATADVYNDKPTNQDSSINSYN